MQVQQSAQALVAGTKAQGHPATPWALRLCLAVYRFPCHPGLFPVRRIHVLCRTASVPGVWRSLRQHRHRPAYVHTTGCNRHVFTLQQKERSAPDARGSHAHDPRRGDFLRLGVRPHVGFAVVLHRAKAAASGDLGPVRGNCFFPDPHDLQSPYCGQKRRGLIRKRCQAKYSLNPHETGNRGICSLTPYLI